MNPEFIPGQRWINTIEPQMGLGTVVSVEHRAVTLVFPATGETRIYARQSSPLARIEFDSGDTIHCSDGNHLQVKSVETSDGLVTYLAKESNGNLTRIHESELDPFIQLNRPTDRLFGGQIDTNKSMTLRYRTLMQIDRLTRSPLRGLTGCRTSLLRHQLYVAHEVSRRHAPRVLLADEVGLGKTIEAGLIIHRQLLLQRISRVLIISPENLVHQWLVELLRRFNLRFSLFDALRCEALQPEDSGDNPFHSEQLVLCSLDFLKEHPQWSLHAGNGEWDMLVVDEAHHLQWSPKNISAEYRIIADLAAKTAALLLLTATPEQLGKSGHFARLHLLDPERFSCYTAFLEEEKNYQPVASAINALLDNKDLEPPHIENLEKILEHRDNSEITAELARANTNPQMRAAARQKLIEELLDRHGTGRIVFRNTRAAMRGFPDRQLGAYPLPTPPGYLQYFDSTAPVDTRQLLSPETIYRADRKNSQSHWTKIDPRTTWLTGLLQQLRPQKVLLITANSVTAVELAEYLRKRTGVNAAVFHEKLSLVERDRAAAYFASEENAARILICSEIGSEGRNFQFAHHLVLFDLPIDPDQLEQRIGRLDRIGQTKTIQIYVPYLQDSPQSILFHWFHDGLNAFSNHCPAGQSVYSDFYPELRDAVLHNSRNIDELIARTKESALNGNRILHEGRDQLLELNSCRTDIADLLTHRAQLEDQQSGLAEFMEDIFDCLGVDSEISGNECLILRPGNRMSAALPELPEDGITITFSRNIALANEDVQYLSWDHPIVIAAMESITTGETGSTAVCAARIPGIAAGELVLECVYLLEPASSIDVPVTEYLPPAIIKIVVDPHGNELSPQAEAKAIEPHTTQINTDTARKIVQASQSQLKALLAKTDMQAETRASVIRANGLERANNQLNSEIERLTALSRMNRNVRREELEHLEKCRNAVARIISLTQVRLDIVRAIVTL